METKIHIIYIMSVGIQQLKFCSGNLPRMPPQDQRHRSEKWVCPTSCTSPPAVWSLSSRGY